MYGLIVKLTVVPGRREEMIGILKESAADMPGCFSYVVAKDSADENAIWVTEVWDGLASHDASLSAFCKERDASSQRDRFEFREDRCHKSSLGRRVASRARPLICGPARAVGGRALP